MSIHKHNNHSSKRRSLLQRALEFIKDTLAFRTQWIHLQKRGKTPNYLYLKSASKDRKHRDKGLPNASNIELSKVEEPLKNEPVLSSEALFEPQDITVNMNNVEEPAATELHPDGEGLEHDVDDGLVDPFPEALEQIEKPLPMMDTVDPKSQLFFKTVMPAGSIPDMIKGAAVEPPDSCTGEIPEAATAANASLEESAHQKGVEEAASSPKKTARNRRAQVHGKGKERRDQMPLPFE